MAVALAHTLAASAFARHEAERTESIAAFFKSLEVIPPETGDQVKSAPLGEELGGLLREQARIFAAAHRTVMERGAGAAKAALKLAAKKEGLLTDADLRRRFPEIVGWLDSTE